MTPEQASVIRPAIEKLSALRQATAEQQGVVLYMAAMVEPKILDPESGISFDPGSMTFTYPESTGSIDSA